MAGSLIAKLFRNRRIIRAPIGVYRVGLGFLFGRRLLLLEHTGRRSGAARFVVLEVVTRPTDTELVVASALGREAQWFGNLVEEPSCRVSTGFRRRVPATAQVLDPKDAREQLAEYQEKHPALWQELNSLMASLHGGATDFELPLVRLTLQPGDARTQ